MYNYIVRQQFILFFTRKFLFSNIKLNIKYFTTTNSKPVHNPSGTTLLTLVQKFKFNPCLTNFYKYKNKYFLSKLYGLEILDNDLGLKIYISDAFNFVKNNKILNSVNNNIILYSILSY